MIGLKINDTYFLYAFSYKKSVKSYFLCISQYFRLTTILQTWNKEERYLSKH